MSPDTLLLFTAAVFLLALSPGPDNLFVITQALAYGAKSGMLITLGLCTGLVVHTLLIAAGVTAVVAATPMLFDCLKWLGAIYLCTLAWQIWQVVELSPAHAKLFSSSWAMYKRGIFMNLANPKVGLFFLAFLPQFVISPGWALSLQLLILGGIFILVALAVFIGFSCLAGRLNQFLSAPSRFKWLNRTAAGIFVLMAIRLVVNGQ